MLYLLLNHPEMHSLVIEHVGCVGLGGGLGVGQDIDRVWRPLHSHLSRLPKEVVRRLYTTRALLASPIGEGAVSTEEIEEEVIMLADQGAGHKPPFLCLIASPPY